MGFTEKEVLGMLEKIADIEKIPTILKDMRQWYNGYLFHPHATEKIYNADMVLYFLIAYKRTETYPDDMLDINISSDYSKLRRLFALKTPDKNYKRLQEIVEGKTQRAHIVSEFSFQRPFNKNDFLSLLYYLGFLTITGNRGSLTELNVPNHVIKKLYFDFFIAHLLERENIPSPLDYLQDAMIEMAFEGNPTPFFQLIERVLKHLSRRDYQNFDEKHIKAIIISLAVQVNTFFVKSERENEGGYTDILFLQRPPYDIEHQYVFELKYLKKENAKDLTKVTKKAKEQILNYLQLDTELKMMNNLQAWTVVVVKDKVVSERVK